MKLFIFVEVFNPIQNFPNIENKCMENYSWIIWFLLYLKSHVM